MPWKQVWEENPSDNSIAVLKAPPDDFEIIGEKWALQRAKLPWKIVRELLKEDKSPNLRTYYRCHYCDGWIEGEPYEYSENSLGPLCGRNGTAYSCVRCGREIGFTGMVS